MIPLIIAEFVQFWSAASLSDMVLPRPGVIRGGVIAADFSRADIVGIMRPAPHSILRARLRRRGMTLSLL